MSRRGLNNFELTAIMPARNSIDNLKNILSIVKSIDGLPIQLVIVADLHDPETEIDLTNVSIIAENSQVYICSGDFNSPGLARNAGIDFAESNFVTFWDCDDKPFPKNILEIVKKMRDESKDIAVGNFKFSDPSKKRITRNKKVDIFREISSQPGLWRMIFDKDRVKLPKFRDFRMAEDQVFLVELEFEKYSILRDPLTIYEYKTNVKGQLTRSPEAILDTGMALDLLLAIYFDQKTQLRKRKLLKSFTVKLLLSALKYGIPVRGLLRENLKITGLSLRNLRNLLQLSLELVVQVKLKIIR